MAAIFSCMAATSTPAAAATVKATTMLPAERLVTCRGWVVGGGWVVAVCGLRLVVVTVAARSAMKLASTRHQTVNTG